MFTNEIPIKVKFSTFEQAVHLVISKEDLKGVLLGFPETKGTTEAKQFSSFNVSVDNIFQ